ncbi:MAG: MG2 domain-containing protein, partial [Pseudomonadota bacterium]
ASDSRFVAISDLGIFVKSANDGSQDIFVHSIASGQPLAGANVQLISKNSSTAMSALSDARGHARLGSPENLRREKEPVAWLVSYNGDQMFMPFRRSERMLRYSRFDVGGEYAQGPEHQQSLKAQLFTDRGLYRPGESVHIGAIVKRNDWKALPELPLKLQIRDPRGQIVQTRSIQVSKSGLFDSLFVSDATYPTGTYQLSLRLSDRRRGTRQIGQASFRLEEFQPDSMRIRTEFVSQGKTLWLQPDDIQFSVQLDTLYGSPASDRTVKADLALQLSQLRVPAFPDYRFSIPLPEQSASQQLPTPELPQRQTDSSGQAQFQFSLDELSDGFYRLAVSAEGFELAGGRSVKSENAIAISANRQMLGIKTDGDLSFVYKDSDRSVSLVAVDSTGAQQPIDKYAVRVDEEQFVSSLIQNDDGSFAYQSVRKYQQISESDLAKTKGAQTLALDTSRPGTYRVRIIDQTGKAQSEFTYTVAGARNLSANLERDAELTLSIDGDEFLPGETLAINITAPYSGAGLITIERDRVLAHRWFKTSQTSSIQRITLPDDIEGNAYINVSLVRDLDSDEVFINPLSYAVSPIKITPGNRKLGLKLNSAENVRPGQILELTATTNRPAKAIVYAVDAGILQAAKYKAPNPLEFFLPKMALQVDTYQLADLILPRHANLTRRAAPGGGEGRALLGQNLNPFRRKAEAPVVFWSGVVDLGRSDKRISIPVPDHFNGELKIFAVAVDQDGVGAQATRSLSKAPIVIQPNVLPAVTPGDEFFASTMIGNELGRDATIQVRLELPETLESLDALSQEVQLAAGAQASVEFSVKSGTTLGASELKFVASNDDLKQARTTSMSIRPAVNFAQTLVSGQSSKSAIDIKFPRLLRPQFAEQSLVASASPLILTDGLKNYLAGFPHACTEQMVSKVFPQLGLLQAQLSPSDRGMLANEV